ncbi:phenylacetate--CoA ligase family protein [Phenylobacterium terrae]|uniref:Phenylacetate--CoA ligase family protein n=1 Tax=Phenylobacterium terrae TaxID=2665495 RepID=A0ABW4MZG0_9CAUL
MDDLEHYRRRLQAKVFAGAFEHVARLGWSAERVAARQAAGLRALLAHAQALSPFHARRLKGVDAEAFRLADLPRLPVMTKADMMAGFDEVPTDRRLTRAAVEQALAETGDRPKPLFGDYVCYATGGSSGVRGIFVWDAEAMAEFVLSTKRPGLRAAMSGQAQPGKAAMVAAGSAVHMTGSAEALTEGTPEPFVAVPATLPLEVIVARLNAIQPQQLFGYPSMLARLAAEQAQGRLAIAPGLVTCSSETLTAEQRQAIRTGFGAPVVNTFACTEGLVGHSAPDEEPLTFNSDICLVELVDADYRPVPPGRPSDRVLVTNLANRVQPLIRYELSDRFVQVEGDPACGHLQALVEGRSDDVLRYGRIAVHPHAITSVMVRRPEVADYQVRQTPRGIEVDVLGRDDGGLGEALRASLARAGLPDPQVAVRAVAALPHDARTGKLRRIVPAPALESA